MKTFTTKLRESKRKTFTTSLKAVGNEPPQSTPSPAPPYGASSETISLLRKGKHANLAALVVINSIRQPF